MAEGKGTLATPKQEKEAQQSKPWTLKEVGGKPVWEWMQLLIVPLALAVIGLLFEMQQADRQRALEQQQAALEDRRAKAERELAVQRAQDEALQAYLSQMSSLLLERSLRVADKDSEVSTLARARTVTVLQRLDAERNQTVIRFLTEARLTGSAVGLLVEADLQGTDLRGADLNGADLSGADLSEAKLNGVNLSDVNLSNDAVLIDANLSWAPLSGADLSKSDLTEANLRFADLIDANLNDANLSDAKLSEADLTGAKLRGAILFNANLRRANLNDAKGVTEKQLEKQTNLLEGATMPNGSIHP
jgi:uncharacterized protein YjbI with pentapeptide repeats